MKLAHLLPVPLINCTPTCQTVHLALAPLVVQYPDYANFLKRKLQRGDVVIVDNPVHEDQEIDPTTWLAAIRTLRMPITPSNIIAVIPDVIDDDSVTVKQAEIFAPMVRGLDVKLMAVPHGADDDHRDFRQCARKLISIPGITHLGISLERRFNDDEKALNRRLKRLAWIGSERELDNVRVHLLGSSEGGHEFLDYAFWSRAESVDSSKFAVFALNGEPQMPGPISTPYPGRKVFGGSMEYFNYAPRLSLRNKYLLKSNLTRWSEYAERFDNK